MASQRFTEGRKYLVDGGDLNRIFERLDTNQILPSDAYDLEISPGKGTRLKIAGGDQTSAAWGLVPTSDDPVEYTCNVGSLLQSTDIYDDEVPCDNPNDSFFFADGDCLALKITEKEPTGYTLEKYSTWPITDGYTVEVTGDPMEEIFSYRICPLWYFRDTAATFYQSLSPDLWAKPAIFPGANLCIVNSWFQVPEGARIQVPAFLVHFAAP